jgi:hypothetical protein
MACVTPLNLTRIIPLKSPPGKCHEIFYSKFVHYSIIRAVVAGYIERHGKTKQ